MRYLRLLIPVVAALLMLSSDAFAAAQEGPPPTMLGLNVSKEDISKTLAQNKSPLQIQDVQLFSLRQDKLLEATLEIGRFKAGKPWTDSGFDLSIADQLGGAVPVVERLQGQRVYITTARGLVVAVWMRQGYLFIMAIRNSYSSPKDLIRQGLQVNG